MSTEQHGRRLALHAKLKSAGPGHFRSARAAIFNPRSQSLFPKRNSPAVLAENICPPAFEGVYLHRIENPCCQWARVIGRVALPPQHASAS